MSFSHIHRSETVTRVVDGAHTMRFMSPATLAGMLLRRLDIIHYTFNVSTYVDILSTHARLYSNKYTYVISH